MTSIEKRAYDLFTATLKSKIRQKLLESNRGIWTGKLIEELDISVDENDGVTTINVFAEDYLEFIDLGVNGVGFQKTKSGKLDRRFNSNKSVVTGSPFSFKDKKPPIKAIKPWAESKNLNPYAVQTSIYQKGIKGINFFESSIDEELDKMLDYLTEAKIDSFLNDFGDD